MTREKTNFRRSIWAPDDRYALPEGELTPDESRVAERLAAVEAAKKRTPPIPLQGLLAIAEAAKPLLDSNEADESAVERFLGEATAQYGAGLPVSVCMLAVLSDGRFPPIDTKIARGLQVLRKISDAEATSLQKSNLKSFARVYVGKVLPYWRELRQGRSAEECDNFIASAGNDAQQAHGTET